MLKRILRAVGAQGLPEFLILLCLLLLTVMTLLTTVAGN